MSYSIIFDTREQRLYDKYVNKYGNENVKQENLDIGDIIIEHKDPDFTLVFERKTWRDLNSSIKDGRYREQKSRMLSTYQPHHCSYILEGLPSWDSDEMESAVKGAWLYSMYRDKIHIISVSSMNETVEFLYNTLSKVNENPQKFISNDMSCQNTNYIDNLKIKKKKIDNVDVETCYLLQWCQIPGISTKIAKEIIKVYPSWKQFYKDFNDKSDKEIIAELCKIPMVGNKKAENIYKYLR